jgi:hypothetical protein
MEELYRVLAPEGKATILTAYYASSMAFADYEVEWPPVCEQSFLFFNKKWRETNNITAPIKCDFEFGYAFAWSPEVATRSTEVQAEFLKSRLNVAQKLQPAQRGPAVQGPRYFSLRPSRATDLVKQVAALLRRATPAFEGRLGPRRCRTFSRRVRLAAFSASLRAGR